VEGRMAKELPYFKFTVADWLTGDIVFENYDVQGLFINICAIYWQREGALSLSDINKRFKNPPQLLELKDRFLTIIDDAISIKFLDEQFTERKKLSCVNSENGKKGGRPKTPDNLSGKPNANRTVSEDKAKQSNKEKKREEKKREEEEFFDEKYKLKCAYVKGELLFGNQHQRGQGGMSEKAIMDHCKNEGIIYEK